jgi:hypothetical protein
MRTVFVVTVTNVDCEYSCVLTYRPMLADILSSVRNSIDFVTSKRELLVSIEKTLRHVISKAGTDDYDRLYGLNVYDEDNCKIRVREAFLHD